MQKARATALAALAATILACGGAGSSYGGNNGVTSPTNTGGGTSGSSTNVISISNSTFSPGTATVPAGTTVTWQWNDCSGSSGGYGGYSSCVSHNVTFDDGSNIASAVQDSGSFQRAFPSAGTYKYHCSIHGAAMSGVIVVK